MPELCKSASTSRLPSFLWIPQRGQVNILYATFIEDALKGPFRKPLFPRYWHCSHVN